MTLDCVVGKRDLVQGVERDVSERHPSSDAEAVRSQQGSPDIVIPVAQKLAQDVDRHHSKSAIRFDLQNRQHRFIQNRVSDVLGRVRIGGNLPVESSQQCCVKSQGLTYLSQDIVHRFTRFGIPLA